MLKYPTVRPQVVLPLAHQSGSSKQYLTKFEKHLSETVRGMKQLTVLTLDRKSLLWRREEEELDVKRRFADHVVHGTVHRGSGSSSS